MPLPTMCCNWLIQSRLKVAVQPSPLCIPRSSPMPFTNARNRNDGFTLIEVLVVLIMIGILSAITAPSVLGLYARFQVKSALNQVQGAFQEGQRQAMRTSKTCSLSLDNFNSLIAGTCLLTGTRQLNGVSMRSSLTAMQFN